MFCGNKHIIDFKKIMLILKQHGYVICDGCSETYLLKQLTGKIPLLKTSENTQKYNSRVLRSKYCRYSEIIKFIKEN